MLVSFAEGNEVRTAGLAKDRVQPFLEPVRFRAAAIRTVKLDTKFIRPTHDPFEQLRSEAIERQRRLKQIRRLLHPGVHADLERCAAHRFELIDVLH